MCIRKVQNLTRKFTPQSLSVTMAYTNPYWVHLNKNTQTHRVKSVGDEGAGQENVQKGGTEDNYLHRWSSLFTWGPGELCTHILFGPKYFPPLPKTKTTSLSYVANSASSKPVPLIALLQGLQAWSRRSQPKVGKMALSWCGSQPRHAGTPESPAAPGVEMKS